MSNENNKRYVGEVYIDGKSDQLLQRFLTNLFDSYNGEDKGFIADMLDNWHLQDILEYVNTQDATKLDTITIGHTIFSVLDPSKFLQASDVIYNNFKDEETSTSWITFLRNKYATEGNTDLLEREDSTGLSNEDDYLLYDILLDIYYVLDFKKVDKSLFDALQVAHEELEEKHNQLRLEFEDFKDKFSGVLQEIEIVDEEGNTRTSTFLNAQLINGFQIIPITQAKYDALPNKTKNFWRYIYIIRDNIPEDYDPPIQFDLLKHISFEFSQTDECIYYHNGISDEPIFLCSLKDLLRGANFDQMMYDYITNNDNIIYNANSLKESLKALILSSNEFNDYPFVTRTEGHTLVSDIESNSGSITNEQNENGFQSYDITHAFDDIFGDLGNKTIATQLSETNTTLTNGLTNLKNELIAADNILQTNILSTIRSNYMLATDINSLVTTTANTLTSSFNTAINELESEIEELRAQYISNSLRINILRTDDSPNVSEYKQILECARGYHQIYAKISCDDPNFSLENRSIIIVINGVPYEKTTNAAGESGKVSIGAGLPVGSYVVQAFVRGAKQNNIRSASDSKVIKVS